jgi:hypothetical protein
MEQANAFEQDATNFDALPVQGTANLQTRAVGGAFTATAKVPPSRQSGVLAIYGDAITIDRTHVADAAAGLRDIDKWIEKEAARRVRETAGSLDTALFTDPGTGNTIKGLSKILDGATDIPGFTGVKGVVNAKSWKGSGNNLDLTDAANYGYFIEGLIKDTAQVDGAAQYWVNRSLYARMYTIARKEAILGESRDLFGRPVSTFNGIPFFVYDDTAIPLNEPDDAGTPANVTTSLYIVAPAEMGFSLVTNEGLYYREWEHMESKESSKEEFEIRLAWKIEYDKAIRRVRNLKV